MNTPDNSKLIKAIAFEKAVLEILKQDNPKLNEYYQYTNDHKNFNRFPFDGVVSDRLNLSAFEKNDIIAQRIVIEIKAGRPSIEILRRFVYRVEQEFDAIVFIIAAKTPNNDQIKIKSDKCNIYYIYEEDLVKNSIIKAVLYNLDEYITSKDNILIKDNYTLLKHENKNLAFALGAGCSRKSNISDWDTLSKALGYELLYNIIDTKESLYKNKLIADTLNDKIFDCFDKNSALDAIQNSFMALPSATISDYWLSIKNVLYMSYDSPNDANQPLMNSIVNCIRRNGIDSVINYNFDSVLEQNINNKYKSKNIEIQDSTTSMIGCTIYHVHGYVPFDYDGKANVSNFIFTDKEYYENMINPGSFTNVTQAKIINSKNVIFVGVSFTDSNMKEILRERKSKGYTNTIFAFLKLPKFEFEGRNNNLMESKYKLIQERYFDSLGVKTLWVKEFDEIPQRIDSI